MGPRQARAMQSGFGNAFVAERASAQIQLEADPRPPAPRIVMIVIDLENNRALIPYRLGDVTRITQAPIVNRGEDRKYRQQLTTRRKDGRLRDRGERSLFKRRGFSTNQYGRSSGTRIPWGATIYTRSKGDTFRYYKGRRDLARRLPKGWRHEMRAAELDERVQKGELRKDKDSYAWVGNPFGPYAMVYKHRTQKRKDSFFLHGTDEDYQDPDAFQDFTSEKTRKSGAGCIRLPNRASKWLFEARGQHKRYFAKDQAVVAALLARAGLTDPGPISDYTGEPWMKVKTR